MQAILHGNAMAAGNQKKTSPEKDAQSLMGRPMQEDSK